MRIFLSKSDRRKHYVLQNFKIDNGWVLKNNSFYFKSIKTILTFRSAIRHLKIPGQDELGRLPEVNSLNRACARELSTHLSAVLISSRTPFRPTSRRMENVSIWLLFCLDNCSKRLYFQLY